MSESQWHAFPSKEKSLEAQAISQQQQEQIQSIIENLLQRTQEIFRLYRVEGLTQIEVAEILNVSLSTVEKHLANALAMFIHQLRD